MAIGHAGSFSSGGGATGGGGNVDQKTGLPIGNASSSYTNTFAVGTPAWYRQERNNRDAQARANILPNTPAVSTPSSPSGHYVAPAPIVVNPQVDPNAGWGPNSEGGIAATQAAANAGVAGAQAYLSQANNSSLGSSGLIPLPASVYGSPAWYQQEIINRESTARSTTVQTPGYANTLAGDMVNKGYQLTPQQATFINYTHDVSTQQTKDFFAPQKPFLSVYLDQTKQEYQSPADNATNSALGGIPLSMYKAAQEGAKKVEELKNQYTPVVKPTGGGYNPFTTFKDNIGIGINNIGNFYGALAALPIAAMMVPYAATWSVYHPTEVPKKAVEVGKDIATQTFDEMVKNPYGIPGTVLGMYAGGKVVRYGAGKIGELNPVHLSTVKIPTGEGPVYPSATDSWLQNKLGGSPVVQGLIDQTNIIPEFDSSNRYTFLSIGNNPKTTVVVGGVARGSEVIPQIFVGRTGFDNILSGTRIERATDLYQTLPQPWSTADKVALQPFFTKTAADPFTAEVANLKDNLARADANLNGKYIPDQLIGTAPQMDLTFDQSVGLQKMMMMGKETTQYYGSRSLVDVIGEPYFRDVSASDIDANTGLDIANAQMKRAKKVFSGSPYKVNKNTLYDADMIPKNPEQPNYLEPNKEIIGNLKIIKYQMKPEETPGVYTKIKQNTGPWNDLNDRGFYVGGGGDKAVFGTHPIETGTEIQTMPMPNIAGGITNVQTPTDFILTKAGKTIGRGGNAKAESKGAVFKYNPHIGKTIVNTVAKKQDTNLLDIYASSRYIAKTAYDNHLYELAKTFEQTSDAVALKLKDKLKIDVKDKIQKDILEGVSRSPSSLGAILGVGLGGIKIPQPEEVYPTQQPITPKDGYRSIPVGVYPTSSRKIQQEVSVTPYPGYTPAKEMVKVESYPTTSIVPPKTQAYPVKIPVTHDPYPYPVKMPVTHDPYPYPVKMPVTHDPYPYPVKMRVTHDPYPYPVKIPVTHNPNPYPVKVPINHYPKTPIIPNKLILPEEFKQHTRGKLKHDTGKRFVEVFSLAKYPGFKTPGRAHVKNYQSTGKKFGETFSLVVGKGKRRKQK